MFKSGYVVFVGLPNVGKSTLLNAILGQKLAATCNKPQTTRHKILGIKTSPEAQILFLDIPGFHEPHRKLNEMMVSVAQEGMNDADLVLFMTDALHHPTVYEQALFKSVIESKKKYLVLVNKIDQSPMPEIEKARNYWKDKGVSMPHFVSAINQAGVPELLETIIEELPEGPPYYPEDQVTDVSERFLASEAIREKVMELFQEEIPYGVAVVIEDYKEPKEEDRKKVVRIRASIVVEKDSQKPILIGKGGQMIKKIGEESRKAIEKEIDTQVFLELFVRVEKDWTKDERKVRELGYEM